MIKTWPHTFLAFLVFVSLFFLPQLSPAHDSVWPGQKLENMYPAAQSFEQKNLYVSSRQKQNIEKILGESLRSEDLKPSIYFAVVKKSPTAQPKREAVLIFIDAEGKNGVIETGLVMGTNGAIKKLIIFENNEQAALSSPGFADQFVGKKSTQPFAVGIDITAPKGLEMSSQAVASGARRGLLIINELFKRR